MFLRVFLFFRQYKAVITEQESYNLKDIIHQRNKFADFEEIEILQVNFFMLHTRLCTIFKFRGFSWIDTFMLPL